MARHGASTQCPAELKNQRAFMLKSQSPGFTETYHAGLLSQVNQHGLEQSRCSRQTRSLPSARLLLSSCCPRKGYVRRGRTPEGPRASRRGHPRPTATGGAVRAQGSPRFWYSVCGKKNTCRQRTVQLRPRAFTGMVVGDCAACPGRLHAEPFRTA